MAKKINKKKQRRNLIILLVICLLMLLMFIGIIRFGFHLFSKEEIKQEEVKQEKVKETLVYDTVEDYEKYNVNELGQVPVMMYHGIDASIKNSETGYTGGNIDIDGYQRTAEAFRKDLEMYYEKGYRMIRLTDYVDGNIDVEAGKSPLVLTFDDGISNNCFVTGEDKDGNIIIDPDSAVGILESFKEKYPDYNVIATFFVNGGLFSQPDYNEKILNWLVDHGYDVGNHTYTHCDFTEVDPSTSNDEVGLVYSLLDEIIPGKYVNIVALPFGSPYDFEHENMPSILKCSYDGKIYETKCTLQVGWEQEVSPFDENFNPQFVKRIRAYDNGGTNFDIEFAFNQLEDTRYISDGNKNTIVISETYKSTLGKTEGKEVITY